MDIGSLQQIFPELEVIIEDSLAYTPSFYHKVETLQLYDPNDDKWKNRHGEMMVLFYPAKEFKNTEGTLRACQLSNDLWNITLVYNTDKQLISLFRWRGTRGDNISMIEV